MTMSEGKRTPPIVCAHCGNTAEMLIVAEYNDVHTFRNEDDGFLWDEGHYWELLKCHSCDKVTLRESYYHEYMNEEELGNYKTLYPIPQNSISGLPDNILKTYTAAHKVKPIDTNAFAVLLGRMLDLVCIDKNAEGDSLFERLTDLAVKGIMPSQLAEMAHALRQIRNIGAHANLGELTENEVPILEALSRAILEYVYSAPALMTIVQAKIDALKTKKP